MSAVFQKGTPMTEAQKALVNRGEIAEMLNWTPAFEQESHAEQARLSVAVGTWLDKYELNRAVSKDGKKHLYDRGVIAAVIKAARDPIAKPVRRARKEKGGPAAVPLDLHVDPPLFGGDEPLKDATQTPGTPAGQGLSADPHGDSVSLGDLLIQLGLRLNETPVSNDAMLGKIHQRLDEVYREVHDVRQLVQNLVTFGFASGGTPVRSPEQLLGDGAQFGKEPPETSLEHLKPDASPAGRNPDVNGTTPPNPDPEAKLNNETEVKLKSDKNSPSQSNDFQAPKTSKTHTTNPERHATVMERRLIPVADVPATQPYWEQHVTPTQLGNLVTPLMTPQEINQMLCTHGYQKRVGNEWIPTQKGTRHAQVTTGEKNNAPYTHVLWKRAILRLLFNTKEAPDSDDQHQHPAHPQRANPPIPPNAP